MGNEESTRPNSAKELVHANPILDASPPLCLKYSYPRSIEDNDVALTWCDRLEARSRWPNLAFTAAGRLKRKEVVIVCSQCKVRLHPFSTFSTAWLN
jgi:hypothetical protein